MVLNQSFLDLRKNYILTYAIIAIDNKSLKNGRETVQVDEIHSRSNAYVRNHTQCQNLIRIMTLLYGGGIWNEAYRPVYVLLSRFYLDFILILSKIYPDKFMMKSG